MILPPLMIPKSQSFDVMPRQKLFSRLVKVNAFRQTVLKAVKFNRQFCIGAIEIQNVSANRVLPAKFETRETASAQCAPKLFFFVSLTAAKPAGDVIQAHVERMKEPEEKTSLLTPALSSFSEEREKAHPKCSRFNSSILKFLKF